MKAKLLQKQQARELRNQGKSLRSISLLLGVAKSSVSLWCQDIALTSQQAEKLKSRFDAPKRGALANKVKRHREVEKIRRSARPQLLKISMNDIKRLRDIGTVLYWAEGTKSRVVAITNSDPEMIKVAMLWFRNVCLVPEEKFRVSIYYHSGQNEKEIKEYWAKITKVPLDQFHKSILKKEGTGHRKNILYNGTCKVLVCDKNLLCRILTWIEQLHIHP